MTDEPKNFLTSESGIRYMVKKEKEFQWLVQKVKKSKTEEEKGKNEDKLMRWLINHPTLTKVLLERHPKLREALNGSNY